MGQEASKHGYDDDEDDDSIQETDALKETTVNGDGSSDRHGRKDDHQDPDANIPPSAEESAPPTLAGRSIHGQEFTSTRDDATPLKLTADADSNDDPPRTEQQEAHYFSPSSSSSSSSSSPSPSPSPTRPALTTTIHTSASSSSSTKRRATAVDYQELCVMKKARNQARLKQLGFGPASPLLAENDDNAKNDDVARRPTLSRQDDSASAAMVQPPSDKSRNFPHRSGPIRQLKSLLLLSSTTTRPMTPSPIFVTGPKGTGKSCIVRHVLLEAFAQNPHDCSTAMAADSSLASSVAFVDCAATGTIHPPKTTKYDTAILHAIYDQFSPVYRSSRALSPPWKLHLELLELNADESAAGTTGTTTTTTTAAVGSSPPPPPPRLVVLDHADGLTLDTLQQLLCLPNICWIILTRSSLLSMSVTRVCPIHVRFPAYQDRTQVRDILLDDHIRRLVTGTDRFQSSFTSDAYKSFVDSFTQAMSGSTDIRTYIRKGRLLWPRYIAPLRPENIHMAFSTMGVTASPSKADVIGHLDQLMLPHWRRGTEEQSQLEFPKLGKYLLLAAFICQSNHHDSDKSLFLTQRNGKRRKQKEAHDEAQASQPRSITSSRASFPLERLFSVYVSIVSLNEREQQMAVGDLQFFDRLAYLKDLGILQKKGQGWICMITAAKALAVAESIHFSLGSYVTK